MSSKRKPYLVQHPCVPVPTRHDTESAAQTEAESLEETYGVPAHVQFIPEPTFEARVVKPIHGTRGRGRTRRTVPLVRER